MDEATFIKRFREWESSLIEKEQYDIGGMMPKYDQLCSLYLEATPEQRKRLPSMVTQPGTKVGVYRLGFLMIYMQLVSERIQTPEDVMPLRLGLAAAAMSEDPIDWVDILRSLAFLHYAATQAGINPRPHFKEIADTSSAETGSLIRGFLSRRKRDIKDLRG